VCAKNQIFLFAFSSRFAIILNYYISQGSARTYLRCGEKYYAVLLEIFILYSAVKEFWKSVKIWESYCQKFGAFLFLEHGVCFISNAHHLTSPHVRTNSLFKTIL